MAVMGGPAGNMGHSSPPRPAPSLLWWKPADVFPQELSDVAGDRAAVPVRQILQGGVELLGHSDGYSFA